MGCWLEDPKIKAWGVANGNLTTGKEFYKHFMDRYARILAAHDKTAMGWYEVFDNVKPLPSSELTIMPWGHGYGLGAQPQQ